MEDRPECELACGFRLRDKLYAQFTFIAMGVLGTIGIILEDWIWIIPYVVFYWYGIPGVVMRYLSCPRCPHLHEYGDCLQFPVSLARMLVKKRKVTPFSALEKFLFYMIFILIPVYPIYWLLSSPVLFVSFLLAAVMWYSGQFFYFCKRCRVSECPFNRVAVTR
jgi:hypothetical protein